MSVVEYPSWLTESFISKLYEKDSAEAKSFDIISCKTFLSPGDNYSGVIYRLKVKVNEKETTREDSFVVKCSENTDSFMKDYGVVVTELDMYEKLLKRMEGYYKEATDSNIEFGPRCLLTRSPTDDVIVLSDLRAKGFEMKDRFKQLDLDHAELVLNKMAQFHSAGYCYKLKVSNRGMIHIEITGFTSSFVGNRTKATQSI